MIKGFHVKALFWFAVGTWILVLLVSGEPVSAALLKPSGVVLAVVTATIALFERYMWRWNILHPWFVAMPKLMGTYVGKLSSNWTNPSDAVVDKEIDAFLSINQTLSGVTVRLLTAESASVSLCASLIESPDHQWELVSTYRNEPRLKLQERSRIHHGGLRLLLHGLGTGQLTGNYFTDRGTAGEMTFRRISDKTSPSFSDAANLTLPAGSPSPAKSLPQD